MFDFFPFKSLQFLYSHFCICVELFSRFVHDHNYRICALLHSRLCFTVSIVNGIIECRNNILCQHTIYNTILDDIWPLLAARLHYMFKCCLLSTDHISATKMAASFHIGSDFFLFQTCQSSSANISNWTPNPLDLVHLNVIVLLLCGLVAWIWKLDTGFFPDDVTKTALAAKWSDQIM